MEARPIRIAVEESSDGYPISPQRVPLSTVRSFARDVEDFIRGDEGVVRNVEVKIVDGSLALETMPIADASLFRDLRHLASSQLIDSLDTKRRNVVSRWQHLAKSKSKQVSFKIDAPFLEQPIVVNRRTDFRMNDSDQWARVERYLIGLVYELGGLHSTNVHVRLVRPQQSLVVKATKELLGEEPTNRLFKTSMLRVRGELNVTTGELRDAHLVAFVDYDRSPDDDAIERLTKNGAAAWADVPSAQAWVDSIRGSL